MRWQFVACLIVPLILLTGCSEKPETGLSKAQQEAGTSFAGQYEVLSCQSTLKEDCRRTINNSLCSILIPNDWTQTAATRFERAGSGDSERTAHVIKVIEYPTAGGTLEAAIGRFATTASKTVENYNEQKRWCTQIDGHPAVAVMYEHTEEAVFPGLTKTTKAFFTVKHDRHDRARMRTVIISCTAPKESFGGIESLFDEIACRTVIAPTTL